MSVRQLKIAMDYDKTFTEDREGWSQFINLMRGRGHTFAFVTFRRQHLDRNEDIHADANKLGIPIVFCEYEQKSTKFKADVWIDDMPELIPSYDVMDQISRWRRA